MHNKQVKICWNRESIQHTIICIYILYKFCIQIVYIMFMMYTFCTSEVMYTKYIQNVVYKMYTKWLYQKCILHFDKLLYTFCTQNLAGIVFLILYTKCIQKAFDFVNKMYTKIFRNVVYILYAFFIPQLYASCTIFVYKMYSQFACGFYLFTLSNLVFISFQAVICKNLTVPQSDLLCSSWESINLIWEIT